MQAREQWGSRLGFVLAAAGSAVGLGNIWKFRYKTGENGGGAFLILYLALVFSMNLPLAEPHNAIRLGHLLFYAVNYGRLLAGWGFSLVLLFYHSIALLLDGRSLMWSKWHLGHWLGMRMP